jgi:phosphohistidine phosphatase
VAGSDDHDVGALHRGAGYTVDTPRGSRDARCVIVFLIRHAHAIDEAPGVPDAGRHLTHQGRVAARALAERLRWHDCSPTAVWTSPLTRAVQTAELVVAGLHWEGPVEALPELAPGGDLRAVNARVRACAPDATIVLVGHEPGISGLGTLLTVRSDFPALHKAEAIRLDDVGAQRGEGAGPLVLRWSFAWSDDAARTAV